MVREAGKRTLNMRHFDVQLIGGIVLHNGKIAEMRTGEGKTLVATLPVYLNALTGKGVHLVTVNDYLAQRDADWMGRIYRFLGLTVGVNLSQMPHADKQAAYAADITYGTNNEFGFDYLRDNMVFAPSERVQRGLAYAIVDEVDSILIDEARTPLIISGQAEDNIELYYRLNELAPKLTRQAEEKGPGDYWVDEKAHQVLLSEAGHEQAEELLSQAGLLPAGTSLYDAANIALMHHLYAALRAHALYHRDQHYVVQNGEVIIVDEFTGRLMPGRRWSDGLHQAVEAKEGVPIQRENQTLASITFQNYFRMYGKLAGMTGTADTEAYEFQQIYHLETVVIPTHQPMVREDEIDQVFRTAEEKVEAILADIQDCHERGQPVLVGTTSIENSELLSRRLDKEKLPHQVLNAKQHAREAEIVAQAGRPKMITIATNMAGRGTDIVLGGNIEPQILKLREDETVPPEEKEARIAAMRAEWQERHEAVMAGGLHIVGTERHESRRIDNQLRGRSGRQGDPGSSRFYLSLEDPLLRIFAGERLGVIMQRLKMPEGEAIEHPMVTRSIENAQRKVEARNFDIRKQLLEYDDVANDQRRVIYQQRNELLETADIAETIAEHDPRRDRRRRAPLRAAGDASRSSGTSPAWRRRSAGFPAQGGAAAWVAADAGPGRGVAARARRRQAAPNGAARRSSPGRRSSTSSSARDAADARPALARAPRGPRPPAPGHPPARLRAEEPEAGVQARSLRAVLGHARPHQAGRGARHPDAVQIRTQEDVQAVEEPPAVTNVRYQHADYDEALAGPAEGDGDGAVATAAPKTTPFVRAGRRSAATIRAPAARARSTSSATAGSADAGPADPAAVPAMPVRSRRPRPSRCCRSPASRSAPPRRASRTGSARTCCSSRARPAPSRRASSRRTASAPRR